MFASQIVSQLHTLAHVELEEVAMWNHSEGLPLRDFFATEILKRLMLRYRQPGYSDHAAINEAYQLADYMVECRKSATAKTAESSQHPPTAPCQNTIGNYGCENML
jgi:hypothetical protein